MANFKNVGNWWSDRNIELVEIDGETFALNGWNGESYLESWKCEGDDNMDASEDNYTITPVYSEDLNDGDTYDIIDYEVSVN